MAKNDGGPAFPREDYQTECAPGQRGMSLRDWLAGQALTAFATKSWIEVAKMTSDYNAAEDTIPADVPMVELYANAAYGLADAMLKEREK